MSVTVSIPTPLRSFTGGRDAVAVVGATVGQVLDELLAAHTGLKRHLVQDDGRLRTFVNLYLNDTDIRQLASTATPVAEGDVLTIVPSIAGGSPATETALPKLSHAEVLRYSRHLLLPEVGVEGQRKLKAARVLTIGAGGLGSPLSLYLAAAGVGTIGIVDFDVVDLTNLQRQIVHGTSTLGHSKLESAKARLTDLNPNVNVVGHEARLTSENALDIIRGLRHRRRRHGQLPHPLPGERRLRAAGEAERLRQHLPVRGPGLGVLRQGRALLPLPLLGAAAAGTGAELRRGRRARRAARHHRQHPGARDHQVDHRGGGLAHRAAACCSTRSSCASASSSCARTPSCPICGEQPDDPRADRLPGLLRHRRRARLRRRGDRRRGFPARAGAEG